MPINLMKKRAAHILQLDSIHSRYYGKAQIDLVETFDREKILNMTEKNYH